MQKPEQPAGPPPTEGVAITDADVFIPSENVSWRSVDEDMIVLNLQNGEYYTFNDTGKSIWIGLTEEKNIGTIVGTVSVEYGNPDPRQVNAETRGFVFGLLREGLIKRKDVEVENETV